MLREINNKRWMSPKNSNQDLQHKIQINLYSCAHDFLRLDLMQLRDNLANPVKPHETKCIGWNEQKALGGH